MIPRGDGFHHGYLSLAGPSTMELSDLPLAPKQPTLQDDIGQPHGYDKAPTTKFLALMGLGASWILGIVCVIVGSGAVTKSTTSEATKAYQNKSAIAGPYHDWPGAKVSPAAAEILPLLVSFIVTALMESTGLIHETSLRWALQDKLVFNSNLRLFTFVRQYFCFGAISNILHAVFIVVSYAAASLMFAISPSQNFCNHFSHTLGNEIYNGCGDFVALATPAVCALGIGLLGQAGLATWQMLSVRIPTWSANPLDTAWASVEGGTRARVPGRCMMSVHEAGLDTGPKYPKARQLSIWKAHKEARRIMYFVWTLTVFSFVWFGVTQGTLAYKTKNPTNGQPCSGCNAYLGNNWNLIPDQGKSPTSAAVIVEFSSSFYAGIHTRLRPAGILDSSAPLRGTHYKSKQRRKDVAAVLFLTSLCTAAERFVQGEYELGGCYSLRAEGGAALAVRFGASILTAFTTFLSFQRPNDEQPATFSHVQTLVDLVDEWHLQIFWGDKGAIGEHEVRHAGTSAFPLNTIIRDAMYEGSLLVQESNSEAAVN